MEQLEQFEESNRAMKQEYDSASAEFEESKRALKQELDSASEHGSELKDSVSRLNSLHDREVAKLKSDLENERTQSEASKDGLGKRIVELKLALETAQAANAKLERSGD
jgi:t-SNARE complex subunit (syntaxin)